MVINDYEYSDRKVTKSDLGIPNNPIVSQIVPTNERYHIRYYSPYESDRVGIIRSRLNLM